MRELNKYQLTKIDAEDAYFNVGPATTLTPSTDTKNYAQFFAWHDYKIYIDNLLIKLHAERYHTYIVGLSIETAANALNSYIADSAKKYGPMIKELTNTAIEVAIRYASQETTEVEKDETITIADDAATDSDSRAGLTQVEQLATTDSSLRKRNDTPQAGNNPNLTSDTYLSQSERNEANIGARITNNDVNDVITKQIGARLRTTHNIAEPGFNYTTTRRMLDVPHIASLIDSIVDLYGQWLKDLPLTL